MTDVPLTPEYERVVRRAVRLHVYHTLTSHPEIRSRRVLPSMVSDYVDGTHPDTDGAIAKALRTELPLRRLYNHLRDRRSRAREIEQIAAAGGASAETKLVLDHATLYWGELIPGDGRQMLRLQIHDSVPIGPNARPVLHIEGDDYVERIVFQEITDKKTAQYLLEADDPRLVRLMADAGCTKPATRYRVVV